MKSIEIIFAIILTIDLTYADFCSSNEPIEALYSIGKYVYITQSSGIWKFDLNSMQIWPNAYQTSELFPVEGGQLM